ncbi:phage holin family protein [Flindersiella endophytica]
MTTTRDQLPRQQSEPSVGQLVAEVTADLQALFRQEIELAKAEVRQDAKRAATAAGMFGTAGFAGYMVAVLLSLAAVFGLGALLGLGWSALIVAGVWAVIGAVAGLIGRSRMKQVSVKPERTVESLKEDAAWLRHPTG